LGSTCQDAFCTTEFVNSGFICESADYRPKCPYTLQLMTLREHETNTGMQHCMKDSNAFVSNAVSTTWRINKLDRGAEQTQVSVLLSIVALALKGLRK
jgi:hypothetical protein